MSSSFANLARLVAAYGCDAKHLPRLIGLFGVTALRQPVFWWEAARHGRRIRKEPIKPPVFIIGHWRSGTTHLHNVISQDPQFGRVTLVEAGMPHDFLTLSARMRPKMAEQIPDKRLMDNVPVAVDSPWEEEMALTSTGRMSFYHVSFFPRCMEQIFDEAVMFNGGDPELVRTWQRQYTGFLRKVQYAQCGLPLLLKNPANTARIRWLRTMFPGARFIHIRRNPYKVFTSTVHLYLKVQEEWGLHDTDPDRVARHVLESYPKLMRAYFDQREELGSNELVEVSYAELQQDPLGMLRRAYGQLGLPGFEAAAPRFEAYLASQSNYRKNELTLRPEDSREITRRWQDIFEQLEYAV